MPQAGQSVSKRVDRFAFWDKADRMSDRISLDFNQVLQTQVGAGGLSPADFESVQGKAQKAHEWFLGERQARRIAFMELPFDAEAARAAKELGSRLAKDADNVVVLGIGGSALGPRALFTGLADPFHNLKPRDQRTGARVFFPDNPDPATFSSLLEVLDLSRTRVIAITKSGGTAETWSQLLILRDLLQKKVGAAWKNHVVAVTDPAKGSLRSVAKAEGFDTLPVPPEVGGRFSVLTAVGLLPAAAAGIDIDALLAGAGEMAKRCEEPDWRKNPAYLLASALYLLDTQRQRRIHVFMPYSDALRDLSDWFVQLWAESLGKTPQIGPSPMRAVGAVDQHSMLQLLMEGPQDKAAVFVAVEKPRVDMTIPKAYPEQPDVAYLGGHTLHGLLSAEQRATAAALAANGRPSVTIKIPAVTPKTVGGLMMLLEVATAFAGGLYGVNPFDQPGVEAGKRYACGLMGRPGYEASRDELARRPASNEEWVLR
jgi:glucose-6-phosphate isomerase